MLVFKPCENFLLLPPKLFTTTTRNSNPHLLPHHHVKLLHFSPLKAHFKSTLSSSPLSSSSSSPAAPSEEDSSSSSSLTTTVDFLMDSGGLSYEQALQVIREKPTLLQDWGTKPRSVISYFESIGFSKTHISKVISKLPRVLVSDVDKTLKPKIQLLLHDFGFSKSDIADLIASKPLLLFTGVQTQMKPGLELIKSFVKTDEDLIKIIKRNNHSLFSTSWRNSIEPNIDVLRQQGVPDSAIVYLISLHLHTLTSTPKVFKSIVERIVSLGLFKPETKKFSNAVVTMSGMNKSIWDSKIELLKGLGWSELQILDAFRRHPKFLAYSEKKIKEGIEFFKESLNWDASVFSQHPIVVNYSLKVRVIPRCAVLKCLMSKEIIKKDTIIAYMLALNETQFLSEYVFKYQDQIPYLYEVYEKECMMETEEDNGGR